VIMQIKGVSQLYRKTPQNQLSHQMPVTSTVKGKAPTSNTRNNKERKLMLQHKFLFEMAMVNRNTYIHKS